MRFVVSRIAALALTWVALSAASPAARAENLYHGSGFSALAADRRATQVGDSLTVVINETTSATNSNHTSSSKATSLLGQLNIGSKNRSLQVGTTGAYDGSGETSHAGKMLAQLSVVVDQVLPNGDLHVSGYEALNINGERTRIKLSGRVRVADISSTNSVPSSSLADAVIDYDGKGFVANSAKPGFITRIFNWLGLI